MTKPEPVGEPFEFMGRTLQLMRASLKYSPDQPRVPAGDSHGGEWTNGMAGTRAELQEHLVDYKRERELTGEGSKPISEVITGAKTVGYLDVPRIDSAHELFLKGQQPTLNTNPQDYANRRDRYFKNEPVEDVPFTKLTFTQPRVNEARVRELVDLPAQLDKPVSMVKVGDDYYVINGHHRAAAAFTAGRETMRGNVLDLTNARPGRSPVGDETGGRKPTAGDKLVVFRAQSDTPALSNRNAGNATAVSLHLTRQDDAEKPSTSDASPTHVHAYQVTVNEFGTYEPMAAGTGRTQGASRAVGREQQSSHVVYSFPENGHWSGERIATVPVETLRARLKQINKSDNFDDAGPALVAQVLRQEMAKAMKASAKSLKYNPDEPRVPAGNEHGGEWTDGNLTIEVSPKHPLALQGLFDLKEKDVRAYVEEHGQEWQAQPVPDGYERGTAKECYKNASQLVMYNPEELRFVEGYASYKDTGIAVMHAWAVDKHDRVIDVTVPNPTDWHYFGVQYDTKKYMRHLEKTMMYGVLGGDQKAAAKIMKRGGL